MKRKKKDPGRANVVASIKKPKQKGKNEAQRKLDADWDKLMASHAKPLERGAKAKGVVLQPPKPTKRHSKHIQHVSAVPALTTPPGREGRKVNSLVTPGHEAPLKEAPKYTGTKMKGVATMHKSNSVPVFSEDEAVDIAHMRR